MVPQLADAFSAMQYLCSDAVRQPCFTVIIQSEICNLSDGKKRMTTEVHIKKCRSYLPYLSRIMSCVASGLGMNSTEIKKAEYAVERACLSAIDVGNDTHEDLIICFDASDSCVTVDITGSDMSPDTGEMTETFNHRGLADVRYDIDTIESSEGKIIRIVSPGKPGIGCISRLSLSDAISVP